MDQIIGFANAVFTPIINMGAAPMMVIILTVIACCFKVKFSEALMGGLKLGIAITGISAVIGLLTTAFSDAMTKFVASTGIQLTITDLGWAPLATITWGSPYTLFFLLIMVLVDIVMIVLDKTNAIDVDVVRHLAPGLRGPGVHVLWGAAVGGHVARGVHRHPQDHELRRHAPHVQ